MPGLHDKVLRVILDYPAEDGKASLFDVAKRFNRADAVPERRWRKRSGVPKVSRAEKPGDETAQKLEAGRKRLEVALASYYSEQEGRGKYCTVEHYQREGRLYWFAYVQDYEEARIEYDNKGQLDRRTCKPVFEVIFVHSNAEHMLDTFVKGGQSTVTDLQELWGRAVLDTGDLGTPPERGVEYELNTLKKTRRFPFDVRDGIEAVRVSSLRLSYKSDPKNRRITLEANTLMDRDAVFDMMAELLKKGGLSLDDVNITQAEFKFVFAPDAHGGGETISACVSHPNSCSLKHEPKEEIARKYLREWKIDVAPRNKPDPEGA